MGKFCILQKQVRPHHHNAGAPPQLSITPFSVVPTVNKKGRLTTITKIISLSAFRQDTTGTTQ
jgi:hypothetical protein